MLPDKTRSDDEVTCTNSSILQSSVPLRQPLHIPASLLTASSEEIEIELHATEGDLQAEALQGLHGHVFVVGALPTKQKSNTQVYNGDGMIYRLDFERNDQELVVRLKTRIAKTPCYYADQATQYLPKYEKYKFSSAGLSRIGELGTRNQLNTAFLPVNERLLITFDAGRPYEIHPRTLELLCPAGFTDEWIEAFSNPTNQKVVFPTVLSPAHPAYDANTNEIFTANYSTGWARVFPQIIQKKISTSIRRALGGFTDLIRWNIDQPLQRWRLELLDGSGVFIDRSLHQIGVTENYLVLTDIAFQIETSQVIVPRLLKALSDLVETSQASIPGLTSLLMVIKARGWEKPLKNFVSSWLMRLRRQEPFTNLYIVQRQDLADNDGTKEDPRPLKAKKVVIPREIGHVLVDYNDNNDCITIHASHNNAWDVTEWITDYDDYDRTLFDVPLRKGLEGMVVGPVDIGFLGRYRIDGKRGILKESKIISDPDLTWAISLFAYHEPIEKIKTLYWLSWGFYRELIPKRIFEVYKDHPYRAIPIENFLIQDKFFDKPVQLLRLDTEKMEFKDKFSFPENFFASSPQFVPKAKHSQSQEDSDDSSGYIICFVTSDKIDLSEVHGDQIWIFDANDLGKGPLCKLKHPKLDFGLTLHSSWMPDISQLKISDDEARSIRRHAVHKDYQELVDRIDNPDIKQLFNEEIYKNFELQKLQGELEISYSTRLNQLKAIFVILFLKLNLVIKVKLLLVFISSI